VSFEQGFKQKKHWKEAMIDELKSIEKNWKLVGLISRYMVKPTTSHMIAAKRILRYVMGTCNYRIQYSKNQNDQAYDLIGYSNSN